MVAKMSYKSLESLDIQGAERNSMGSRKSL